MQTLFIVHWYKVLYMQTLFIVYWSGIFAYIDLKANSEYTKESSTIFM